MRIKILLASLALVFVTLIGGPAQHTAALFDHSKTTACQALGSNNCTGGDSSVKSAVTGAVKILSFVAGVIAVIMIVVGGIKYITSNGDSGSISSAKNTIIYALVGLIVAILAPSIVAFVVNRV